MSLYFDRAIDPATTVGDVQVFVGGTQRTVVSVSTFERDPTRLYLENISPLMSCLDGDITVSHTVRDADGNEGNQTGYVVQGDCSDPGIPGGGGEEA